MEFDKHPTKNPDAVIAALRAACDTHTYLHVGQVLHNALEPNDPYYIPDELAAEMLRHYAETAEEKGELG